jgi:cysteine desulfurase/selenocysteine lyase
VYKLYWIRASPLAEHLTRKKELDSMRSNLSTTDMRELVVGVEETVTLLDGSTRPYINFDNASSTPFLRPVLDRVNDFAPMYASVGRGSGYKSHISTEAFDAARVTVGRFVGAGQDTHAVILGKNTTEALNRAAHCLRLSKDDVVLTSLMEHHSNDLPWRKAAEVHQIGLCEDGTLDMSQLLESLHRFGSRVRLVAVTGASNVTGLVNPIHDIAKIVHDAGALIAVDAAQLAPHRAIDVGEPDDPRRIDFLACTGHKMYAPLGIGALVALRSAIRAVEPELVGGGTVAFVTSEDVVWSGLPAREEAGTPNVLGAIGWAQAIDTLRAIGMDRIAEHETELAEQMRAALRDRPGIHLFGGSEVSRGKDRLGVIGFAIDGVSHGLAAAILGYEGGIGVRTGLFCAHPYVQHLLGMTRDASRSIVERLRSGEHQEMPGLIRASFGIYNTLEEVDAFVEVLDRIRSGDHAGKYVRNPSSGALEPSVGCTWSGLGDSASADRCCPWPASAGSTESGRFNRADGSLGDT